MGYASKEIAELQQEVGTKADVIIESGNAPKLVSQVAEQAKSNLLVVGRIPGRGHLGANGEGYSIIRDARIPVLSV